MVISFGNQALRCASFPKRSIIQATMLWMDMKALMVAARA